jgi:hypothetical protein
MMMMCLMGDVVGGMVGVGEGETIGDGPALDPPPQPD